MDMESTRANTKKPMPKIKVPMVRMMRGPNWSTSQPCNGPSRPLSRRVNANAADSTVMLQPNSSFSITA